MPGTYAALSRGQSTEWRATIMVRETACLGRQHRTAVDAELRHGDHVSPVDEGGPTSVHDGQGLCAYCNYVKQSPGWQARTRPGGLIETTTPTGHC